MTEGEGFRKAKEHVLRARPAIGGGEDAEGDLFEVMAAATLHRVSESESCELGRLFNSRCEPPIDEHMVERLSRSAWQSSMPKRSQPVKQVFTATFTKPKPKAPEPPKKKTARFPNKKGTWDEIGAALGLSGRRVQAVVNEKVTDAAFAERLAALLGDEVKPADLLRAPRRRGRRPNFAAMLFNIGRTTFEFKEFVAEAATFAEPAEPHYEFVAALAKTYSTRRAPPDFETAESLYRFASAERLPGWESSTLLQAVWSQFKEWRIDAVHRQAKEQLATGEDGDGFIR